MAGLAPKDAITVSCSRCGAKLLTRASAVGKLAKCHECGGIIEISPLVLMTPHTPAPPAVTTQSPAKAPRQAATPVAHPPSGVPEGRESAQPGAAVLHKTGVETRSKPAPAPKAARPAAPAAPAPTQPRPAKPAESAIQTMKPMSRMRAMRPSAETLAKFAKPIPPVNGSNGSIQSFPAPDKLMRVWGQMRQPANGSDEEQTAPAEIAPSTAANLIGRTRALVGRLTRAQLVIAGAAIALLVTGGIAMIAWKAASATPPSAVAADADWRPMDYTTHAAPRGKEPSGTVGDTKISVRIKFEVKFTNPDTLGPDDWDFRDSSNAGRAFYNPRFTLTDKVNRIGTLDFIVSGQWQPDNLSFGVKRQDTRAVLGKVPCKD
jgi:hypothetical protein